MFLAVALAVLIAAAVATALAPAMILAGVTDEPDHARKAHCAPTPTSGGLAIGAGFAFGLSAALLTFTGPLARELDGDAIVRIALAAAFGYFVLALGFADDLRPLNFRIKAILMVGVSIGVGLFVAHAEALPIAGALSLRLGFVLGVLGSALWVFTLMNAANFMDGANGLAIGSIAISLAALALLCLLVHAPAAALMAAAGAGAMIGFLVWNWPAGKVFAGDSGSLFAGMLGAAIALVAIQRAGVSPFVAPVMFFPLLADSLLTLAWRASKRRSVFHSHNEHLYQVAIRAGLKPVHVSLWYWLATLGCAAAGLAAAVLQRFLAPAAPAEGLLRFVGLLASAAPAIVWAILAIAALRLSREVRAFAARRAEIQ